LREVSEKDKLFYFEKNFFTLDGLWMIETEAKTDWETALKIDLAVWRKLLKIIFRRIRNYLNIQAKNIKDLIDILTFRWSCESWEYKVESLEEKNAKVMISKCPYKEIMGRNPERQAKTPLICKDMCIPFYESIVKEFNPKIKVIRTKYQGLGDKICDFKFEI